MIVQAFTGYDAVCMSDLQKSSAARESMLDVQLLQSI